VKRCFFGPKAIRLSSDLLSLSTEALPEIEERKGDARRNHEFPTAQGRALSGQRRRHLETRKPKTYLKSKAKRPSHAR
jgi:hypothetical protein